MNWEAIIASAQELLTNYGLKVVGALAFLILGRIIVKLIKRLIMKVMGRAKIDETLISFTASVAYVGMMAFVVIGSMGVLGIPTASFVAVLGAAGLAVGLALQGSLSNFASGVLMIIFKPFAKGDFIDAAGVAGSVQEIGIFNTELLTPDNKKIIVPNASVTGGNITNFSAMSTRRIDLVAGVGYQDDLKKVRSVLEQIIASDDRILQDPAPTIGVLEMADSSVNFAVRPWVNGSDYWAVYFDLQEQIKVRFDEEGISIPFPQQDVWMHQVSSES